MVNLFSFGCHGIDGAHASRGCKGGVGETIKREGRASKACLGKSTSCIIAHSQNGQLTAVKTG